MEQVELGLDTFGDVTVDDDGSVLPQPRVIRSVVEEAVFADQLGVDFIGLASITARTSRSLPRRLYSRLSLHVRSTFISALR